MTIPSTACFVKIKKKKKSFFIFSIFLYNIYKGDKYGNVTVIYDFYVGNHLQPLTCY